MTTTADQAIRAQLVKSLRGGNAFETFDEIVRQVPENKRFAAPEGKGKSAWQIIEHMRFTLDDLNEFIDNADGSYEEKEWPAGYWRESTNPADWERSLKGFHAAQRRMEELILSPERDLTAVFPWGSGQTLLHEAILAIEHTAYHLGELVELTVVLTTPS